MPAKIITGNIFTTNCQTIVNTINCVGVMGAGIALECRLRYPDMHEKYIKLCMDNHIDIGLLWIYKSSDKWVLNFPTKNIGNIRQRKNTYAWGLRNLFRHTRNEVSNQLLFHCLARTREEYRRKKVFP